MKFLVICVSINICVVLAALLAAGEVQNENRRSNSENCNDEQSVHCKQHLACVNSVCKCNSTTDPDEKFVYVEEINDCLQVAKKWESWDCQYNIQCKESQYGNYSRCLTTKYSRIGSCECHDEISGRQTQLVDGTCTVINSALLTISSSSTDWSCNYDYQCTNGSLGKYSRCNTRAGSGTGFGRCECFDTDGLKREIKLVHDVCYLSKRLGQSCTNSAECNASIAGEAICLRSPHGEKVGLCKCAEDHQFEPTFQECLKLGTVGSACKTDFQCQHLEALGDLSKCLQEGLNKSCQCWDTREFGKNDVKYQGGRCRYARGVNQTCTEKLECTLGYHGNADCLPHPSYNGEKVCQCSHGFDCHNGSGVILVSTNSFFVTAFLYMYFINLQIRS